MRRKGDAGRLTLADFARYVKSAEASARGGYRATEAARAAVSTAFAKEMEAWQAAYAACYPLLAEGRGQLPQLFRDHVDRVEQEELARLRGEIAALDSEIAQARERSDALLAAAQQQTDALRALNPKLAKKEETLQAQMVRQQNEYAAAYERAEALGGSTFGWLTNAAAIGRERRKQRAAKKQQEETLAKLRLVRQQWLEEVQKAGERQAELRAEWQQVGVRLSEAQTKRDHLQENIATLGEQAAFQRVLEELTDPPDVPGEAGEAFRDLARRNGVRRAYERALEVSAEFLGRTKGVADGLQRFGQSVDKVVAEQRRYNLKQVQVRINAPVAKLLGTWEELAPRFQDPAAFAARPADLSALLEPYNRERLSDGAIKALFEDMGNELNRATAAWG